MLRNDYKELVGKARDLRNSMTSSERLLWDRIRMRKIDGYKFRRQQPVLNYIADFYCHELKLIIEVDGECHTSPGKAEYDRKRERILNLNGYKIFHLSNKDIETNLNASLQKLKSYITGFASPFQGDRRGSTE